MAGLVAGGAGIYVLTEEQESQIEDCKSECPEKCKDSEETDCNSKDK